MFEVSTNLLNQVLEHFDEQLLLINDERSWSFLEFFSETHTLSKSFKINSQERIILCSENQEFVLKSILALWMLGAVAVPLNPKFPHSQKNELIQKIDGIDDANVSADFHRLLQKKTTRSDQPKYEAKPQIQHLIDPEAWATIFFTSGSTGSPKAVVHSLSSHFFSALGANELMPLYPGDRWLLSLPLYHVGGLAIFFRTLLSGAAMVIPSKNKSLVETLQSRKVTHLSLVPTQLQRLLQTSQGKDNLRRLKIILLGGAPIPQTLLEQTSELGLNVQTTYGSTEMASQVSTGKSEPYLVLPFREVRIAADNEIEVRGKTRFLGYLDEAGLHRPFDKNGWFKTGDLGAWCIKDPKIQGCKDSLTIFGRKDNMFISGGENVHPEEIERCLLQFQNIEQAIVVPVKDSEFGERPVAFVKSAESASESELRQFLEKRLTSFKVPDLFLPWPELVETDLKPDRNALSQIAQIRFDQWQKGHTKNDGNTAIFNQWLNQFPLGWMRVDLSEGRQIFLLLDLRKKENFRCLYVRANSREEVMEWLLAAENRKLLEEQNDETSKLGTSPRWFPAPEMKRGAVRESFEIVRLLADELPENKIPLYDARDRGTFKMLFLPQKKLRKIYKIKQYSSSLDPQHLSDLAVAFKKGWNWEYPQAVFQSAVWLPKFNRMYLLRCLYRHSASGKKFLGWKVQFMRELSNSEKVEHPFWELNQEEEIILENELYQSGLFSTDDLLKSNTPPKERKRRADFQRKIDNLFD